MLMMIHIALLQLTDWSAASLAAITGTLPPGKVFWGPAPSGDETRGVRSLGAIEVGYTMSPPSSDRGGRGVSGPADIVPGTERADSKGRSPRFKMQKKKKNQSTRNCPYQNSPKKLGGYEKKAEYE